MCTTFNFTLKVEKFPKHFSKFKYGNHIEYRLIVIVMLCQAPIHRSNLQNS